MPLLCLRFCVACNHDEIQSESESEIDGHDDHVHHCNVAYLIYVCMFFL